MLTPQAQSQAERMLRHMIWQALDFDMLTSAEFACERLLALDRDNSSSVHLMGLVLYRQGRYKAAANITCGHEHSGCIYIYGKCCLKLKLYSPGIEALEHYREVWNKRVIHKCSDQERSVEPDSSIMESLLGELYQASGDKKKSVKSFASCLKVNPFNWGPVKAMAEMGIELQPKNIFKKDSIASLWGVTGHASSLDFGTQLQEDDPFGTSNIPPKPLLFKTSQNFLKTSTNRSLGTDVYNTPTGPGGGAFDDHHHFSTPSDGSKQRSATALQQQLAPQKRITRNINQTTDSSKPPAFEPPLPRRNMRPSTTAKRNAALAAHASSKPSSSGAASSTTSTTNTAKSRTNKEKELAEAKEGERYIVDLYKKMASILVAFCRYECNKALKYLDMLPPEQKDTPWVLSKIGRLHFEKVSYTEADRVFQRLRQIDPCRTEDMDYFSTLLWHLRREVELAFLAHELIDIDRTSPQAWCALGNCFSLQRDADQALKCFHRAIQLDPASPYAYTLQAHEHIANDAYENAQESFRLAIRADNRHYNAWYGLGMVFMRLGNIDLAELHFSRASAINPYNVVLICCMGMVEEKRNRPEEALEYFKKACELQPKSALSRYKKARALLQLKYYNAALIEFDQLKTLAPNEASVHFLLGQLYKLLSSRDLAVKHYTIALNLDPKGAHLIKESLESLGVTSPPPASPEL